MMDERTGAVLVAMRESGVKCLLSGGQACIIYGGAEFSRDVDFVVHGDSDNFERVEQMAIRLKAETIAVPPFRREYLDEGLAIHLRCGAPGLEGFRVDLMSRMRGVDPFPSLWSRRTTVEVGRQKVDLMSLRDLIQSKKTQSAKDWPMIQRLLEVHYLRHREGRPDEDDISLWLREMLTPELLIEVAQRFESAARRLIEVRPLLDIAIAGDISAIRAELSREIEAEKLADQIYWAPLKAKLSEMGRAARSRS